MSRYLPSRPDIAVAAIVTYQDKVLHGLSKIPEEEIPLLFSGGRLLPSESSPDAILWKENDELGVKISTPKFVVISNNLFSPKRHSVALYFEVECKNPPTLTRNNFNKCQLWQWFDWKKLSSNLFYPLELLSNTDYNPYILNKVKPYFAF